MICERLLKEREEKVREEYEETMTSKLAGWYSLSKFKLTVQIFGVIGWKALDGKLLLKLLLLFEKKPQTVVMQVS